MRAEGSKGGYLDRPLYRCRCRAVGHGSSRLVSIIYALQYAPLQRRYVDDDWTRHTKVLAIDNVDGSHNSAQVQKSSYKSEML